MKKKLKKEEKKKKKKKEESAFSKSSFKNKNIKTQIRREKKKIFFLLFLPMEFGPLRALFLSGEGDLGRPVYIFNTKKTIFKTEMSVKGRSKQEIISGKSRLKNFLQ